MPNDKDNKTSNNEKQNDDIPRSEWLMAFISLLILGGVMAYLLTIALNEESIPPQFRVEVQEIVEEGEDFLVNFEIYNDGTISAAAVAVEGRLIENGEIVESQSLTLSYVPAQSSRMGGFFFASNPQDYQLKIEALSFEIP